MGSEVHWTIADYEANGNKSTHILVASSCPPMSPGKAKAAVSFPKSPSGSSSSRAALPQWKSTPGSSKKELNKNKMDFWLDKSGTPKKAGLARAER